MKCARKNAEVCTVMSKVVCRIVSKVVRRLMCCTQALAHYTAHFAAHFNYFLKGNEQGDGREHFNLTLTLINATEVTVWHVPPKRCIKWT